MGLARGFWVAKPSDNKESTPQVASQRPLRAGGTRNIRRSLQAIDFIDYFKNYRSNSREFFHTGVCQVAKIAKFFTKLSTDLASPWARMRSFSSNRVVH
jgi:hypothetical protein